MNSNVKKMVICAMGIAITVLLTSFFSLPITSNGYINLGDIGVLLFAQLFGPGVGLIVGAIGSSLSDILLSFAVYAPFSLIVKGIEGLIAGYLLKAGKIKNIFVINVLSTCFMVIGYFLSEVFLYGSAAAILSLPANLVQALVCSIVAALIYSMLKNSGAINRIS